MRGKRVGRGGAERRGGRGVERGEGVALRGGAGRGGEEIGRAHV